MKPKLWLFVLLLADASCGGDDDPCKLLLDCCKQLNGPAASQCQATYDQWRQSGNASEGCAMAIDSLAANGLCASRNVSPDGRVELRVLSHRTGTTDISVTLAITNKAGRTIAIDTPLFSLQTTQGRIFPGHAPLDGKACAASLADGAAFTCTAGFSPDGGTPGLLLYRYLELAARASFDGIASCIADVEGVGRCDDGCDNDGDGFVDCEDRDCCAGRTDCPPTSFCGRTTSCAQALEDTPQSCSDSCDNDRDGYVDCEDFNCCSLVSCSPDTACGRR